MIKLKIKIVGALLKTQKKDEFEWETTENINVLSLLKEIKYKEAHIPHIMVSVNNEVKTHDYILKNSDTVMFFTVVGGG